mmetsp:Transcript_58356/g.105131  ORF Transcript_58356/g.105131 Transcript_58356/m.105131 type:complete len:130 (-) Transcript_58356:80-469(-)
MANSRLCGVVGLLLLGALLAARQPATSTFVSAPVGSLRHARIISRAEAEGDKSEPTTDPEKVFDDWFEGNDATSGGIFWVWLIPISAVLFYVYLDVIYGEKCVTSSLNSGGEFCMKEYLPTALGKVAAK